MRRGQITGESRHPSDRVCTRKGVRFPATSGTNVCHDLTAITRFLSAAHRDKSQEWNVSKPKWTLC